MLTPYDFHTKCRNSTGQGSVRKATGLHRTILAQSKETQDVLQGSVIVFKG
jgi:hypothetical protein